MPTASSLTILASAFLEKILKADRWIFEKINSQWTNPFLDYIMPVWREAITWVPLYLFIVLFVCINFRKKAFPWLVALLVTISLADQISSHILKPMVNRMRPCHDSFLADHIRLLLQYCSDSRSFTSSHATNHFGMAFFLHITLHKYFGKWSYLFFVWAFTISYGQVYIGVHYPTDVLCGAILGSTIGALVATIFNKRFQLPDIDKHRYILAL